MDAWKYGAEFDESVSSTCFILFTFPGWAMLCCVARWESNPPAGELSSSMISVLSFRKVAGKAIWVRGIGCWFVSDR